MQDHLFSAIVFDFDDTMVYTSPYHYKRYQNSIVHFGFKPESFDVFYHAMKTNMGKPWDCIFRTMHPEFKADNFWPIWDQNKYQLVYDVDLNNALSILSAHYELGILSATPRNELENHLSCLGIKDLFSIIVGRDPDMPKPDPRLALHFTSQFNLEANKILYVGDTIVDQKLAHLSGMHFWGIYNDEITKKAFTESTNGLIGMSSTIYHLLETLTERAVESKNRLENNVFK